MALTIDDLRPKKFKINVRGVELECNPLEVSETLAIQKIGHAFKDPTKLTQEQRDSIQDEFGVVIKRVIPSIDFVPDFSVGGDIIQQIIEHVEPSDNKELREKGVKFNTDPKAQRTG